MDNNTLISIGANLSNGNGANTLERGEPKSTQYVSFSQNWQAESLRSVVPCRASPKAHMRFESWTLDGPGSAYYGRLAPGTGHSVVATDPLPNASQKGAQTHHDPGLGALVVLDGAGAGQIRRADTQVGKSFQLDAPLSVPPAQDSLATVLPWRSHFTIAANTWWRGTTVQLFGASWNAVVADNFAQDLEKSGRATKPNAGLSAWGRSYADSVQPCLFAQFLRNRLVNSGHLRTTSWDDNHPLPKPYTGPGYNRGHVHRRNVLDGTDLIVEGSATDVLLEGNVGSGSASLQVTTVAGLHPPVFVVKNDNVGFGVDNGVGDVAEPSATFSSLTNVGDFWGTAHSYNVTVNGVVEVCPRSPPGLIRFNATMLLVSANGTLMLTTSGGTSWSRSGLPTEFVPSIPAPAWIPRLGHPGEATTARAVWVDVNPSEVYPCSYPNKPECSSNSTVVAPDNQTVRSSTLSFSVLVLTPRSCSRRPATGEWTTKQGCRRCSVEPAARAKSTCGRGSRPPRRSSAWTAAREPSSRTVATSSSSPCASGLRGCRTTTPKSDRAAIIP